MKVWIFAHRHWMRLVESFSSVYSNSSYIALSMFGQMYIKSRCRTRYWVSRRTYHETNLQPSHWRPRRRRHPLCFFPWCGLWRMSSLFKPSSRAFIVWIPQKVPVPWYCTVQSSQIRQYLFASSYRWNMYSVNIAQLIARGGGKPVLSSQVFVSCLEKSRICCLLLSSNFPWSRIEIIFVVTCWL